MKIVQLIPQLASGGAERFVVDLSNELSKSHDVVLIVSSSLIDEKAFYLQEVSRGVKVCSLDKKIGLDIAYLYRLYKVIKMEKPDVVHTHLGTFLHFALMKWFFPKIKFVHTVHCLAQFESGGGLHKMLKKIFFKTNWCQAVNISYASDLSFKKCYGEKVSTKIIYNGRADEIFRDDDNDKVFLPRVPGRYNLISVGHISNVKNHVLLCTAITQLTDKGTPLELHMFGRFADKGLVEKIKSLKNPHIHMLGEVENPRRYFANADAFCMSSIREGMPISLIEAMSCGLIPICTPVGGVVEMIDDGKTGFLSHDLSVESYVEAIERFLLLTKEEMTMMKQSCKESSQQYSIELCAHKYEQIYLSNKK